MPHRKPILTAMISVAMITWLSLSGLAQDWQKRSPDQWTKDDIIKLSSDSPWAYVQQAGKGIGDSTPGAYLPAVTIRLRSALPIRQALVRLKQIDAKYDKLNDQQRAEFDSKMQGLLGCPACTDNYVVTLGPPVSSRQMKNGIVSLRLATLGMLEKRVYLANERGERRELVHFIAPKHDEDEASFFFPRLDEQGHALLTSENTKLIFLFEAKNLRTGYGIDTVPERFEFDVKKMILNGKVEF